MLRCPPLVRLLVLALVAALPSSRMAQAQQAPQKELSVTELEKELFDLVNAEREKANAGKAADDPTRIRPALPNVTLFTIARNHAKNMSVQGADHVLDGKNSMQRAWDAGFPKQAFVGENIGAGATTAERQVEDWMNSKLHRDGMLDPRVKTIGVGIAQSNNGTYLWCLNYCGYVPAAANPPKLVVAEAKPAAGGTTSTSPKSTTPTAINTTPSPQSPKVQGVIRVFQQEQDLLDAINARRTAAQLPSLKMNGKLYNAARGHAFAMVKAGQLNHVLDGKSPIDRAKALGYPSEVDEVFNGGGVTAARVVQDWMGVEKLKAKLMNPGTSEIGVGFTQSADTTNIWNIVLGSSAEADNPPRLEIFKPQE